MSSGCYNESVKHQRVSKLERELIELSTDNIKLAPLLEYRTKPIGIKAFRKVLSCLPTFSNKARDDNIFGVARYLTSTLGIMTQEHMILIFLIHL